MGLTAVGLTGASCAGIRTDPPRQAADADTDFAHTLQLAPSELATLDPELRTTLRDNPHHYLRYVANRFVGVSCEVANEGATVNLHGDPHLEQYVVTSLGRGLSDFDEATIGPVGIDLIRLATSIRIASRMRGWDSELLWARFVEGYLHALADPALSVPEPDYARRRREAFTDDHLALLDRAESLMVPVGSEDSAAVEVSLAAYVQMVRRRRPGLDERQFEVVRIGRHQLGIGSRRATNYLIRTRGPTDDASDDLLLEAKEVTRNRHAECLPTSRSADPLRILLANERIAYEPFRDVGFVEIGGRPFWIHEWLNDYVELEVTDNTLDQETVASVLLDVGMQLGHGHPRALGEPYQAELNDEMSRFMDRRARSHWRRSERLAEAAWTAWELSLSTAEGSS